MARLRRVRPRRRPLYRHLDLAREGAPWGEAIEGLLEHLDVLTLLDLSIPLDTGAGALGRRGGLACPAAESLTAGKPAKNSLASVLVTNAPDVRRYLDAPFGQCALAQEPQRNGDYLCPDGRYRIGDIAGTVRPQPSAPRR